MVLLGFCVCFFIKFTHKNKTQKPGKFCHPYHFIGPKLQTKYKSTTCKPFWKQVEVCIRDQNLCAFSRAFDSSLWYTGRKNSGWWGARASFLPRICFSVGNLPLNRLTRNPTFSRVERNKGLNPPCEEENHVILYSLSNSSHCLKGPNMKLFSGKLHIFIQFVPCFQHLFFNS